jgi:hypothetical protein
MPTKRSAKRAAFGADLIEGMKLVLAHQRQNRTRSGVAEACRREGNSQTGQDVAG